jgi:hypothetical protein
MASTHLNIGKLGITFAFRHRFEKKDREFGTFWIDIEFREWELGLWFKKEKILGFKGFRNRNFPKHNLVTSCTFGINLLLCKMWVSWSIGGLHIKEN